MSDSTPKVLLSAGMIQGGLSGVGRYVLELASRISKMNTVDLHVAGLDADRKLFPQTPDSNWISIPESSGGGVKNLIWHQLHLPSILRAGRFDLLHIPSYRRIVGSCPVSQVATVHDCAPFRLRDKYGALRGLFGRQIAPMMARRCQHILTVSEFTKQDLLKFYGLKNEGVDVIYNGLNHDAYRLRSEAETAAFKSKQSLDKPFFLFISRLEHPGKNHLRLIEAYEKFKDASQREICLVLGGAPWHGAEVIQDRVKQSKYADSILMPGFIAEEDLPLWYASAEALVFPSLIEGFGLPVVEALACGLRVATSDRGSLPEVGGDAAIYFDPENVSQIGEALRRLYEESDADRAARIEAGVSHASKFDWNEAAKVTCQKYIEVTSMQNAD